jgi:predicted DCC family thiol-disulfide oxidoreductase YuxK
VEILVYDGDCGICQRSVRLLERVGCRVEPVASRQWLRTHPEDAERCASMVLLVSADGPILEAEHAVAGALRRSRRPLPWLGALIELPGIRSLAGCAYRLVAAHRTRISTALGLRACAIDDHPA